MNAYNGPDNQLQDLSPRRELFSDQVKKRKNSHKRTPKKKKNDKQQSHAVEMFNRPSTGAISKDKNIIASNEPTRRHVTSDDEEEKKEKNKEESEEGDWTMVGGRQKRERHRQRLARGHTTTKVTGSRKAVQQFRAVKRTADAYVGRVAGDASVEDIKKYVLDNFDITIEDIVQLEIKTDRYKAFKITVAYNDRDKLFNSELWPEDVVVDKFYNRSRK